MTSRVHFLDVGPDQYGDAILCEFGGRTVLIDGAHPGDDRGREGHASIPDQIRQLLDQQPPFLLDLLVVSHAHQDHIGCLPTLVRDRTIEFAWALVADPTLGWGRGRDEDRDAELGEERVRSLVAALRDECAPYHRLTDDAELERFIADAVTLEQRYETMLTTLRDRGTRVVRLGQDPSDALATALGDIGLRIVGPSQDQLLECAELINQLSRDAGARVQDLFRRDSSLGPVDVYRELLRGNLDALDVSRPGAAVNLQSVVTIFESEGRRFLFAGDMQFETPGVQSPLIADMMATLRRQIQERAPYDLVKLSHHGSDNAFSEEIFQELGGSTLFGICAGERSRHHPNPATLGVLDGHRGAIRWARTDRNGLVTMTFGAGTPAVAIARGSLSDPTPNAVDLPERIEPEIPVPGPEERPGRSRLVESATRETHVVEVTARIPHVATHVTISVDVAPAGRDTAGVSRRVEFGGTPVAPPPGARPTTTRRPLPLADGRRLPKLLFVTDSRILAEHLGHQEAARVVETLEARGPLVGSLSSTDDSSRAAEEVRRQLHAHRDVRGVVLIGGHDVIPHQRLDCLTSELRAQVGDSGDPDMFVVWSDDVYGDVDGDGLPELPVSRIPDGRSATLVQAALAAPTPTRQQRAGIRNVARPFADGVFAGIPGRASLLVSRPTVFDQAPPIDLGAEQLYFMLHGDYVDSSRFWGEDTPGRREAMNIGNLPPTVRGVVFTGCCWGALTTETPAGLVVRGRPFGQKTPESSIALSALARGATAFIGCTGAHYSPDQEPYGYFGGPMHAAFWRHHASGTPPAQALFNAKIDYLAGMPHGRRSQGQVAIEFKIWRQYTCLGLGW
jgi:beta-lactamase superfamily II metal-dependent hydrolase